MKIIDRQYNSETKETHYTVKGNAGTLVLRADAEKVPEKEILEIAERMNKEKIKEMPIVKAFDLPQWIVKMKPWQFQLYMKLKGLKLIHKKHLVLFYKKGKKVARLKMIDFKTQGKFKKYD